MSKDLYHQAARNALEKEEWHITDDPLHIRFLDVDLKVDIGAERMLAAEKDGKRLLLKSRHF